MKRLLLLEDVPAGLQVHADDTIVALTATACYRLDTLALPYRTVDEVGSEVELRQREQGYWIEQLAWFNRLDEMLRSRLPELSARRIRPAILYGAHLKLILDSTFIRCVEAARLMRQPYDAVTLWRTDAPSRWPTPLLSEVASDRSLNAQIWPLLCTHRGIRYEERLVPFETARARRLARLRPLARAGLRKADEIRYRLRRRLDQDARDPRQASQRLTLLFLQTEYDYRDLLPLARRQGHRCLVLCGNRVVTDDPARMLGRTWSVAGPADETLTRRIRDVADELFSDGSPLGSWPATWSDVPVSGLLAGFLRRWLIGSLSQLVHDSDWFNTLFVQEGVNMVLASGIDTATQAAAVAATSRSGDVQTVLVAHGDGPDVAEAWDVHELFPFDHYFVPDEEFAAYFRRRKEQHARPTARVHVGSARWSEYSRWARRRHAYLDWPDGRFPITVNRPPGGVPKTKPIVLYVGTLAEADRRYLNKPSYSEAWYYRLQMQLIREFLKAKDFTFVLKLHPQDFELSPIPSFLSAAGASHIYLSRASMKSWIPWVDRVILDKPSTTLYQAGLSGVPFHLLLYEGLAMRRSALAWCEEYVTRFSEITEAADAVSRYLSAPVAWKQLLAPPRSSILPTLATLTVQKHHERRLACR